MLAKTEAEMTQENENKETNKNDVSFFNFNVIIDTTKRKKILPVFLG